MRVALMSLLHTCIVSSKVNLILVQLPKQLTHHFHLDIVAQRFLYSGPNSKFCL